MKRQQSEMIEDIFRHNILLPFLLILFFVQGCKKDHETKFYEDGKLRMVSRVDDKGVYNGEFVEYYPNGKVKSKGIRSQGEVVWIERFYLNGNIEEEAGYVDKMLNGQVILYYENGKIKLRSCYNKGKEDGDYIVYDSLGNIYEIQRYRNQELFFYKRYSRDNPIVGIVPKIEKVATDDSIKYVVKLPFEVKGLAKFKMLKIHRNKTEVISSEILLNNLSENVIRLEKNKTITDSLFFQLEFVPDKADTIEGFRILESVPELR